MKLNQVWAIVSVVSAMSLVSPAAYAQRGGGGGGHGGGYGGGMGGGMSSGAQRGGPTGVAPGERPGGQGAQRDLGSDRQGPAGGRTPARLLEHNTRLSEGLSKLLPAGTNMQGAAAGFRNLGEFVAAVHVSNNLGIAFTDLKNRMMAGDSLGEAIHALRPNADAQVEARKARAKAEETLGSG